MPRTRRLAPATDAGTPAERSTPDQTTPEVHNGNGNGHRTVSDVVDLAELFENETAIVSLPDPRDVFRKEKRDSGFRVEIGPLWSPEAQEIGRERRDGIRKLPDGSVDTSDPAFDETILEQVIAVTKRWWKEGESPDGITLRGEFLAPTPENVRKVYTHPRLRWIYTEVKDVYLDRSRFFGERPKTA